MENNLQLKKIGCNNCGAELIFDPGTQMINCNFCGGKFEIENVQDEEIVQPDGILPFSVTKEKYEKTVFKWLSEGDYTPDDILSSSIFESINGVYLPMWYFEGQYTGNWSASSGYDRRETYLAKNSEGKLEERSRTVTDWRPSSGQCTGEFSILSFAGKGKGIRDDISLYAHETTFNSGELKPYDNQYTSGFNLIEYTMSENESWESYGKQQVNQIVEIKSKSRIPGDKYKDFHAEAIFNKNQILRTYIPFWITNYNYGDSKYNVYMDGTSTLRIQGVRPIDKNRKKQVKRKFIPGHILLGIFIIICCVKELQIPEVLFSGIAIVSIAYGFGWFQKNKIINASKERRKEILNNINNPNSKLPEEKIKVDNKAKTVKKKKKSITVKHIYIPILALSILIITTFFLWKYFTQVPDNNREFSNLTTSSTKDLNTTEIQFEEAISQENQQTFSDDFKIKINNGIRNINVRLSPINGKVINKVSEDEIYNVSAVHSSNKQIYLLKNDMELEDIYTGKRLKKPADFKLHEILKTEREFVFAKIKDDKANIYTIKIRKNSIKASQSNWYFIVEKGGWIYSKFCSKIINR